MVKKINWKRVCISICISLMIGAVASWIVGAQMKSYLTLDKPPLSPPSFLFPVVWTSLYVLMGISSYIVYETHSYLSKEALKIYFLQLAFNFIWPIIFFDFHLYFLSLLILILLWLFVFVMVVVFHQINKRSAYLQFPYMIWVSFALYLNAGIWILNL